MVRPKKTADVPEREKSENRLMHEAVFSFIDLPGVLTYNKGGHIMSSNIKEIKHLLQPDWVVTGNDVDKFLAELDEKKPEMEDEQDHYPPYICYLLTDKNGEERLSILYSKWYNEYDPIYMGGPLLIPLGNSGVN